MMNVGRLELSFSTHHSAFIIPHSFAPSLTVGLPPFCVHAIPRRSRYNCGFVPRHLSLSVGVGSPRMINFETSPEHYKHWKLSVDRRVATLSMDVQEDETLAEGYKLKLNSYDLGVDIELADAVQRLRFEHPEVRAIVITSLKPRIFCAGANIYMLGSSSHAFKVNFCKFTNETRCAIEDDSQNSGRRYLAALNGTASGGGYELAIACDEIYLVDDGNSAVSLPEVPLLGVLPGTGGLTRLVDKRKVRRDRADVFSTLAEGLKAKRAREWGLIDGHFPTSKFQEGVEARVREILEEGEGQTDGPGIKLNPLEVEASD